MAYDMRRHLRQSNLIEGIDDPKADKQALAAWEYLAKQRSIDAAVIKRTHKILCQAQVDLLDRYKGEWRDVAVRVGSHVPPPPNQLKKKMTEWIKTFQGLDPKEAHVRFETIHPFRDGNGRTGRMLMWWHEIKLGQEPTLLTLAERPSYYKWFKGRGQPYTQADLFSTLMLQNAKDL